MQTRKDFERAAKVFAAAIRHDASPDVWIHNAAVLESAQRMAAAFAESNPRFDEARFMAACGFVWCDRCKACEATACKRDDGRCLCDRCVASLAMAEEEWLGQQP